MLKFFNYISAKCIFVVISINKFYTVFVCTLGTRAGHFRCEITHQPTIAFCVGITHLSTYFELFD